VDVPAIPALFVDWEKTYAVIIEFITLTDAYALIVLNNILVYPADDELNCEVIIKLETFKNPDTLNWIIVTLVDATVVMLEIFNKIQL
jgi:hypothetical protein